ncbi:hypothetical protein [Enterococcus sp. N249-2]
MERKEEILSHIDFISSMIETIKERNKNKNSLDIKDISDFQRYAETLAQLSTHAINLNILGSE